MNFLRSLRYSMKFMRSYVSKKRKDFMKSFRFLLYSKFYKVIEYLNNTFIGVSSNRHWGLFPTTLQQLHRPWYWNCLWSVCHPSAHASHSDPSSEKKAQCCFQWSHVGGKVWPHPRLHKQASWWSLIQFLVFKLLFPPQAWCLRWLGLRRWKCMGA